MKKKLKKLEKVLPMLFDDSSVTATFKVKGKKARLVSLEVDDDFGDVEEEVVLPLEEEPKEKTKKPNVGYIC